DRMSSIRLPLPFAARENDIDWVETVRADVQALVPVRIVGESGSGKTRLMREFLASAASAGDLVVEVGPDPGGAAGRYPALRAALTMLAAVPRDGGTPASWTGATAEARHGLREMFGHGHRPEGRNDIWSKPAAGMPSPDDRRFMAAEALRWAVVRAQQ